MHDFEAPLKKKFRETAIIMAVNTSVIGCAAAGTVYIGVNLLTDKEMWPAGAMAICGAGILGGKAMQETRILHGLFVRAKFYTARSRVLKWLPFIMITPVIVATALSI